MAQPDPATSTPFRRWLVRLTALAIVGGLAVTAVQSGVLERLTGGPAPVDAAGQLDAAEDAAAAPPVAAPPTETVDATTPTTAAQHQQATLVQAEDDRLFTIVSDTPATTAPYEVTAPGLAVPTVVLTARPNPYDLPALVRLGAVERLPDGSWLLNRSVVVARGAELRIQEPGATLRLASGTGGFASIVAFKGTLSLAGGPGAPLSVTSWDPVAGAPDTEPADGRSYLRAVGARMDLAQVNASDLGFWSGRTGGVAWTGSAGAPGTGSATEVTIERGHYGMFTSRTADIDVNGALLRNNELDGVLLHRETSGFAARGVTSTGNGRDGISASRGAERITLREVTASGNADNGIRIDGSPLAAEATAGGASTAQGTGYTVERSHATGNVGAGVLAVEAGGLVLRDNVVAGNRDGIVLRGVAEAPELTRNTVDAAEFGIAVRNGTSNARVTANLVGSAVIAIQVTDASATIQDNRVESASRYGVSLVGDVTGSSVSGNALGGRGLSALDVNRVGTAATVHITGNDDSRWTTDRDNLRYLRDYAVDHPLLFLWLLILVLPFAARLWSKRRRRIRDEPVHPYRNVPPGPPAPPVGNTDVITSIRRPPPVRPPRPVLVPAPPPEAAAANDAASTDADAAPPDAAAPADISATVLLPVTRVTVVSGEGARR